MGNIPVWAMGYVLRTAGVPCAEEIAAVLARKQTALFSDAAYHVVNSTVLATPVWDTAAQPHAFIYSTGTGYALCTSAEPFTLEKYSYVLYRMRASTTYQMSVYDRATNTWGDFTEYAADTTVSASYTRLMWTSTEILKADGVTVEVLSPSVPKAFAFNEQNCPTAFLYADGSLVFQSSSVPDGDFTAAFADWDTLQYTSSAYVPWLRLDADVIKSVTVNEDVVPTYSDYWFNNCENLRTASLHGGFGEIGKYMFFGTGLYTIDIPEGITKIGDYAYKNRDDGSTVYETVTIPASVTHIGAHAFENIGYVSAVTMQGVVEIGEAAFKNNNRTKQFTIPASAKRIAPYAFSGCGVNMTGGGTTHADIHGYITFENTEGWWVSEDADATEGTAVDVTGAAQNAYNLAGCYQWNGSYTSSGHTMVDGVYAGYYWNRSE